MAPICAQAPIEPSLQPHHVLRGRADRHVAIVRGPYDHAYNQCAPKTNALPCRFCRPARPLARPRSVTGRFDRRRSGITVTRLGGSFSRRDRPRARERMRARRRLMEYELSQGIVSLHGSLTGGRLAFQFLKRGRRLHPQSGRVPGPGCVEEASPGAWLPDYVHSARRITRSGSGSIACSRRRSSPSARFESAASGSTGRRCMCPRRCSSATVAPLAPLCSHRITTRPASTAVSARPESDIWFELYGACIVPARRRLRPRSHRTRFTRMRGCACVTRASGLSRRRSPVGCGS